MKRMLPLVALVPALWFYWQNRDIPYFANFQDDAVYVTTAKALATGQGYRLTFLPGEPFQTKYPPLYPLVLAAVWRVNPDFPNNLGTMVAWNLVPLVALVLGLRRLYLKFGFSERGAGLLTLAIGCVPAYIYLSASVMTECTFFALCIWTLVLLEEDTTGWAAAAGVLAGLAFMTRGAGAPLLLSAPVIFALRRRFRPALAFLAFAAPLPIAWQMWAALHKSTGITDWVSRFYLDYAAMERLTVGLDNLSYVIWEDADSILTHIGEIFVFNLGHGSALGHHVARLIGVAALAGCVRLALRSRRWHYPGFGVAFLAMMMVWHYPPDQRLFSPLTPLLVAGLWTELYNLWTVARQTYARGRPGDRPVAVVFGLILASFGVWVIFSTAEAVLVDLPAMAQASRIETARLRTTFAQVAAMTPKDATILADGDVLLHLYTGRRSYRTIVPPRLFYPYRLELVRNAFAALPDADARPWNFLLVSNNDWRHTMGGEDRDLVRKQIAARPDLTPIWRNSLDVLYARRPFRAVAALP